MTTYIKPITSVNQKRGLFTKQDFVYDEAQDCYRCPAGAELTFRYESFELERQIRYYTTSKCLDCPLKAHKGLESDDPQTASTAAYLISFMDQQAIRS